VFDGVSYSIDSLLNSAQAANDNMARTSAAQPKWIDRCLNSSPVHETVTSPRIKSLKIKAAAPQGTAALRKYQSSAQEKARCNQAEHRKFK